jgi:hypothetical protein
VDDHAAGPRRLVLESDGAQHYNSRGIRRRVSVRAKASAHPYRDQRVPEEYF